MIKIKPEFDPSFTCPTCGSSNTIVGEISSPGTFWVAPFECQACKDSFEKTLPIGHAIDLPMTWNKTKQHLIVNSDSGVWASTWLPERFERFVAHRRTKPVTIRKLIFHETRKVVVLNTLDSIYGHSLLKLFNAQHHIDNSQARGLIIIIPRALEWLVPKGCAEAWVVDLSLNELRYSHEAIENFIKLELNRFDEVFVSLAYSHPDLTRLDIERFTGIRPFDVGRFTTVLPCFTFVLRADRPWLRNRVTGSFHWLFMKLKISKRAEWLFAVDQVYLVRKMIRIIKTHYPSSDIYITGFGKRGRFKYVTGDERYDSVNADIEKRWCMIYSKSHVVIGIHGSNLLLPTAFSAGCLEILPSFRTYNITQDLSVRYNDRRQLFLYRFADQFVSPKSLAMKAVNMIRGYNSFYRNMILNIYKTDPTREEHNP